MTTGATVATTEGNVEQPDYQTFEQAPAGTRTAPAVVREANRRSDQADIYDCLAKLVECCLSCGECDSHGESEHTGKWIGGISLVLVIALFITAIYLSDNLPCHLNTGDEGEGYDDTVRLYCDTGNLTFWNRHGTMFNIGGNCHNYTCTSPTYPAICDIEPTDQCMITVFFNAAKTVTPNLFLLTAATAVGFTGHTLRSVASFVDSAFNP